MQRIRPGQVVASRRVTVTSSGKIKARKNPRKDAIERSVDKTPFGPLIGALDFGGKRKKAKKAKARKARNTRKRNLFGFGKPKLSKAQKRRIELEEYAKVGKLPEWRKREIEKEERERFRNSSKRKARNAKMSRFDRCVKSVTERGGAYDARAVCASAGRRKYGKKKFQAMAKAGKARAARKRARQR